MSHPSSPDEIERVDILQVIHLPQHFWDKLIVPI